MNASIQPGVVTGPPSDKGRGPLVVVQQAPRRRFRTWLLLLVLMISVAFNFVLFSSYHMYLGTGTGVVERHYSGDLTATDKIAVIQVVGEIMPPFTGRALKAIEKAEEDENVKGVVLLVDSPGGLVADSHEIYHELRKLNHDKHKPIFVSMRRLAASGGYYISMGAGPDGTIFAEPTTWTGSIGVLIPHYDLSGLAEKLGVKEDSLKTGPYKDTLSLFRGVSAADEKLWRPILDETLQRFIDVIVECRKGLDAKQVRELATGQIFTAEQAKQKKLIDQIGYLDDAIEALKGKLKLTSVRVVKYEAPPSLFESLTSSTKAANPESQLKSLLDAALPRAYYIFTALPGIGLH